MLPSSLLLLVSSAVGLASASPHVYPRDMPTTSSTGRVAQGTGVPTANQKVLVGGGMSRMISVYDYDGKTFTKAAKDFVDNTTGVSFSWVAFKEPDRAYFINENGMDLYTAKLDLAAKEFKDVKKFQGSSGVVHLEFNKDKTKLIGAAYGSGAVDVYDLGADGVPKGKPTTLKFSETAAKSKPHQANLDPSGKYWLVQDLEANKIVQIDANNPAYKIGDADAEVKIDGACGPRHAVFYPPNAAKATHYFVACELTNQVIVFEANLGSKPFLKAVPNPPSLFDKKFEPYPKNVTAARAAQIVISNDGKHMYVSNRLTQGDATVKTGQDSISHFMVKGGGAGNVTVQLAGMFSSGGLFPRHMQLSVDEKQSSLFVGNVIEGNGLIAFARSPDTGMLTPLNSTGISVSSFVKGMGFPAAPDGSYGPQVVLPIKGSNSTAPKCKH